MMKKKLIAIISVLALSFAFCACGSSDEESVDKQAPAETEAAEDTVRAAIDFAGSSFDEVGEIYTFQLNGAEYELPCTLTEFTDNGWYVDDEQLAFELEAYTQVSVNAYADSSMGTKAFSLNVLNQTEETKTVADCNFVSGISMSPSDSCASGELTLVKSEIAVDISNETAAGETKDQMVAAYGTDEDIYSGSDDESFNCRWKFCERVKSNMDALPGNYLATVSGDDITNIQPYTFNINYNGPIE